jgi:hypothetical protein
VKSIPRPIPACAWYASPPAVALLGGLLPFGSIFIELYFTLTSLWGYKIAYLYGFILLVLLILLVVSLCVAVVGTYFLLNAENWQWQWTSFACTASTGVYVFGYAIYYFLFKTKMTVRSAAAGAGCAPETAPTSPRARLSCVRASRACMLVRRASSKPASTSATPPCSAPRWAACAARLATRAPASLCAASIATSSATEPRRARAACCRATRGMVAWRSWEAQGKSAARRRARPRAAAHESVSCARAASMSA